MFSGGYLPNCFFNLDKLIIYIRYTWSRGWKLYPGRCTPGGGTNGGLGKGLCCWEWWDWICCWGWLCGRVEGCDWGWVVIVGVAGLADFKRFFSNSSTVHILLGWIVGNNSVELLLLRIELGLLVYDSIWKDFSLLCFIDVIL